jgi:hypothetical protein
LPLWAKIVHWQIHVLCIKKGTKQSELVFFIFGMHVCYLKCLYSWVHNKGYIKCTWCALHVHYTRLETDLFFSPITLLLFGLYRIYSCLIQECVGWNKLIDTFLNLFLEPSRVQGYEEFSYAHTHISGIWLVKNQHRIYIDQWKSWDLRLISEKSFIISRPVLNNACKVSCSRKQQLAPDSVWTHARESLYY